MTNYYTQYEMLNEEQKAAVDYNQGPLFVIAGAGTGKTKTLTVRIARLIKGNEVDPNRILAVTFTNKAAREIRERINQMITPHQMGAWLHTFHAFGLRFLRQEAHTLDYGFTFDVIDEEDGLKIIRDIVKAQGEDTKKYTPRIIKGYISDRKNQYRLDKEEFLENIYNLYEQHLKRQNLMDFDDLIMRTLEILETNLEIRTKYQNMFDHILVDEFQDTDINQYKILKILAEKHRNLCVVGDPDQSIYAFRGANYQNSQMFIQDFNAKKIVLNHNYRSTNLILKAANNLIRHNFNRPQAKNLSSEFGLGNPIEYMRCDSDFEEAEYVVYRIEKLVRSGKYNYGDIAVLYRNNALSRIFEDVFIRNGIKSVIYGGLSFYERKEIKDMLAYIKVLIDPNKDMYLKRIINEPKRKIGDTTINKLEAEAIIRDISMFDAIDLNRFNGPTNERLHDFKKMIFSMQEKLDDVENIKDVVDIVFKDSGYFDMLMNENDDIAKDRIDNIKELKSVFASNHMFYQGNNRKVLQQILDQIALYTDKDKNDSTDDAVILSTYHQVKGLEFKAVFMVCMEEGIFPSERVFFDLRELEEERRVAYVGITRAQEHLFVSFAGKRLQYGQLKFPKVSRFVIEMQDKTKKALEPKTQIQMQEMTRHLEGFKTGDKVMHATFGEGIVVTSKDGILKIAFALPHGVKEIADKHPSLKKIK
ncbi:MAG TPA: UvrD-helicase domain-containing protein [Acholeplasma sp.]|nr:UvrD-helicase domain-containing protein [Acholeplasma sp.]